MQVIAVLNQKGGAGKTTIATHLARALQIGGADVVLVDSDPQGSARDWAAVREDQELVVLGIDRPTLEKDVPAAGKGRDFVVIDGAPQAHVLAVSAIKTADLVLIPVQPSPYDIWAASDLVELVKQRQALTDGTPKALQAAFLISRAIPRTILSREIADALEGYELPVLDTVISQRVAYPVSAADGRTALDTDPEGDAAFEMRKLAREVQALVGAHK